MRKALGRGLDALIPAPQKVAEPANHDGLRVVPIEKIRANRLQPRKNFDAEKLSELAASIKEHGLAQPIIVSHDGATNTYEVIAGERRLRAASLAGLKEIEVVVRTPASDEQRLALALIENLQREDLNPIEEALGYLRLMKEFRIRQVDLTQIVGKSKSAISNTLRLLELPDDIQKALEFGQLSEGHARALLMVENQLEIKRLFTIAVEQKLSVREVEDLARQAAGGRSLEKTKRPHRDKPADIKAVESSLQHSLGTKVEIKTKKDATKGSITVHFYSLDDFDKIVKMLKI